MRGGLWNFGWNALAPTLSPVTKWSLYGQVEIGRLLDDVDHSRAARVNQREQRPVLGGVHVPRRGAHVVRRAAAEGEPGCD
eukprot:6612477-Prymnesium_polylepis.1